MAKRPIYYDTETTGVKPGKDRIIEIAAFDPVKNKTFCAFVNPQMAIPEESTQISGITDDMVKDAPTYAEVGREFYQFCAGEVVLIAHNNDAFDIHFITLEAERTNIPPPTFPFIDSLKWARKYRPDLPRHSLQYLREIYNIKKNNAHRALDDVMVLHNIFSQMVGDLTMEQIYQLIYKQDKTISQMPFGKHRGEPLNKVPKNYLKWLAQSGALDKPENTVLRDTLTQQGLL